MRKLRKEIWYSLILSLLLALSLYMTWQRISGSFMLSLREGLEFNSSSTFWSWILGAAVKLLSIIG